MTTRLKIGIDASNIRAGGGVTHLSSILGAIPDDLGHRVSVVVWAGRATLSRLPSHRLIQKVHVAALDGSLVSRSVWRQARLDQQLRSMGADILFVPGGTYLGSFRPYVAMAQNLLPFEPGETRRYGVHFLRLKLQALELLQLLTFRRANGLIHLTEAARETIRRRYPSVPCGIIIRHGVDARFIEAGLKRIATANETRGMRWLYPSILEPYKHQLAVIEAARILRNDGLRITLDLVGPPAWKPTVTRVTAAVREHSKWLTYKPNANYQEMLSIYGNADYCVFASSCESFGMIPLEALASGLLVASSGIPAVREILGPNATYFNPDNPASIAEAMRATMAVAEPDARRVAGVRRAASFSWAACADATISYLAAVADGFKNKKGRSA